MPIAESEKVVRTADLKARTKQFALRVMKLVELCPEQFKGVQSQIRLFEVRLQWPRIIGQHAEHGRAVNLLPRWES